MAPGAVFEQILIKFWIQLGAVLGGKLGSCWDHVGQKIDSWRILKAFKIDQEFQHHSGSSWGRFWDPKCNQNRSKIDLCSDHEANAKVYEHIGGAVFLRIRGFEHRSIIDQNRVYKRSYMKRPKRHPKMIRNRPHAGRQALSIEPRASHYD